MAGHDAAAFDRWYADMAVSPVRDEIVARTLGLPPLLRSSSLLSWQGIAEVTGALRVPRGGLLVDVACGRGGYGIEIAGRAGARLIGVDFSAVALEEARSAGAARLPVGWSEFRVGTLLAAGLAAGVADGVLCVDAVQFAGPPLAALLEFRRLLRSGGRLAVTCWEAVDPADERVPARIRGVDLRRDLPAAGFADVAVHDRPDWHRAEQALWQAALEAPAADEAMLSLRTEARRCLAAFDAQRRVFATATAP